MKGAELNKDSIDYQMFSDLWNFRKKHYEMESLEDFDTMLANGLLLGNKYKGNELFTDLIVAHYEDAERRYKAKHKPKQDQEQKKNN